MLNKEEELFLDHLIERAEISTYEGYGNAAMYSPERVLPIYKKLKELNDELKDAYEIICGEHCGTVHQKDCPFK